MTSYHEHLSNLEKTVDKFKELISNFHEVIGEALTASRHVSDDTISRAECRRTTPKRKYNSVGDDDNGTPTLPPKAKRQRTLAHHTKTGFLQIEPQTV